MMDCIEDNSNKLANLTGNNNQLVPAIPGLTSNFMNSVDDNVHTPMRSSTSEAGGSGANGNVKTTTPEGGSKASNDKIFASEKIEWTATRPKGTQQTYEIYQRNDIDWDRIRTSGDKNFIGKTNAEAANKGLAPQLSDGNFATLHHIGQDSRGAIAEASTRYHGVGKYGQDILHSQYGRSTPNPNFPIDRKKFGVDTREYWKWRVDNK